MGNSEWRPKVGERVTVHGVVTGFYSTNMVRLKYASGDYNCHFNGDVSPTTPESRKPWDVLREAHKLLFTNGSVVAAGYAQRLADELEAAAAPKVPTLAEAVRAYDQDPGAKWSDVMQALAREEKTPAKNVPEEDQRENIYRHPEGWIDGDFE